MNILHPNKSPFKCMICGGDNDRHEVSGYCTPCYNLEWFGNKDGIYRATVWSDPKPKFWLWDFRKRKVCLWSCGYGFFIPMGIWAASTSHWLGVIAALACFAFSKYHHSKLPLAGKDKE